jgi:hypothetical protein
MDEIFPTKGIESQLGQLGITVIDEKTCLLPTGWKMALRAMHRGYPSVILNQNGDEVARWDGGSEKSRFFVVGADGNYSSEDLAYMKNHVWCHEECHKIQKAKNAKPTSSKRKRATTKRPNASDDGERDVAPQANVTTDMKDVQTKRRKTDMEPKNEMEVEPQSLMEPKSEMAPKSPMEYKINQMLAKTKCTPIDFVALLSECESGDNQKLLQNCVKNALIQFCALGLSSKEFEEMYVSNMKIKS